VQPGTTKPKGIIFGSHAECSFVGNATIKSEESPLTIRTKLITSNLIAAAGIFAFAHHTAVFAGPITTYTIDQDRSYISAYVPDEWVNEGGGWVGLDANWDGSVSWSRGWKLMDFKLSGSFSLETVLSEWVPTRSRLYLGEQAIVTDAPDYAGFTLPYFFAKQNEEVSNLEGPCFDFGFYFDPSTMWSCSGWTTGGSRSDEGTLKDGVLSIDGMATIDWWFTEFIQLPPGVEPDPDAPIDYGPVTGEFRYHLVAVEEAAVVPEPTIVSLILGGLGLMGVMARRRKAATA
jgi:hypothetical protein